jgi:hypothetical protein
MLNIRIKTIPHKKHRYGGTVGDYWIDKKGVMQFRVSDLGDDYGELAIFLHEFIEAFLCKKRGIKWKDIDKFDIAYEKRRKPGDVSEPGDDPKAPYRREHRFAENIERQFIYECGIDWKKYNDNVDSL